MSKFDNHQGWWGLRTNKQKNELAKQYFGYDSRIDVNAQDIEYMAMAEGVIKGVSYSEMEEYKSTPDRVNSFANCVRTSKEQDFKGVQAQAAFYDVKTALLQRLDKQTFNARIKAIVHESFTVEMEVDDRFVIIKTKWDSDDEMVYKTVDLEKNRTIIHVSNDKDTQILRTLEYKYNTGQGFTEMASRMLQMQDSDGECVKPNKCDFCLKPK